MESGAESVAYYWTLTLPYMTEEANFIASKYPFSTESIRDFDNDLRGVRWFGVTRPGRNTPNPLGPPSDDSDDYGSGMSVVIYQGRRFPFQRLHSNPNFEYIAFKNAKTWAYGTQGSVHPGTINHNPALTHYTIDENGNLEQLDYTTDNGGPILINPLANSSYYRNKITEAYLSSTGNWIYDIMGVIPDSGKTPTYKDFTELNRIYTEVYKVLLG